MLNRREFAHGLAGTAALLAAKQSALAAPTMQQTAKPLLQLQQEFLDLRFGMFLHLNMATFEQREWGDPKASPKLFNPAHLDTDQWAQVAHSAGMAYGCLTTKHHDGFCLWPTKTTSPSVKDATFTQDVVESYAHSFRKHGIKVCLYFSILDLRAQIWSYQVTPKKIDLIKAQLSELLTNYGEITAIIFDGWNAGWSRITYDQVPFREIYDHVKRHQPNCLVVDHNAGQYPGSALCYTDVKQYEAARWPEDRHRQHHPFTIRNHVAERMVLEAKLSQRAAKVRRHHRQRLAPSLQQPALQSDHQRRTQS